MKKILMLGASDAQQIAITRAQEMGLQVVTCDNRPSNPGHSLANKSFYVSTTDIDGIYKVADAEKIDAIISYASDPGAVTAATVSHRLGLAGDPPIAVKCAQDKLRFRSIQRCLGHPHPHFANASNNNEVKYLWRNSENGLVVKPADRCGSMGLHIFNEIPSWNQLNKAINDAISKSPSKRAIVEERLIRTGLQFGGDYIFFRGQNALCILCRSISV